MNCLPILLTLTLACSGTGAPEKKDIQGYTAFHRAATANDLRGVETMLRDRVPPDIPDAEGVTALHRAARDNQLEMTELLLRYRANPDARTQRGWTPLHLAAMKGRIETTELLIRFGADATAQTPEGENALHLAVAGGDPVVVGEILRDVAAQAAKPEATNANAKQILLQQADGKGNTPFQLAVEKSRWDVVSALLSDGADPNAPTREGRLALQEAVRAGDFNAITMLITFGANPAARDRGGRTAYDIAAGMNRPDIVDFLTRLAPPRQ